MEAADIKALMLRNAEEVNRLNALIHETVRHRDKGPKQRAEWERACREFHERYDELAFPGTYSAALEKLAAGNPEIHEPVLCFLECRPYFFRSGYMFNRLLRKMKRAPLSVDQKTRLDGVLRRAEEWRRQKEGARHEA